MNCSTPGDFQSMNAIFEEKVANQCLPCHPVDDETTRDNESDMCADHCYDQATQAAGDTHRVNLAATSAYAAGNCAAPGDIKTAAVAGSQSKSLFFSQEASSIFDKALEMHAAPTNDPPMWGDDFEDMREFADMLGDIGDILTGNEAVGPRDFYSAPNFYGASKKEPFEGFLDSLDVKLNTEESKSGNNAMASGINTDALNEVADLPAHNIMNMNMDKRIFEDSMFMGDIAQAESDNNMDSFFFGNTVPGMLNCDDASPDTAMYAENLLDHVSTARAFPFGKQESLDSPAPWPSLPKRTASLPIVSPQQLNSTRISGQSMAQTSLVIHHPQLNANSLLEPSPPKRTASLPIVSPQHLNSPRISGQSMAQMSLEIHHPQLNSNSLLGDLGDCSSLRLDCSTNSTNCNNGIEAAATRNHPLHSLKHQQHPCKESSKSDAAWKRRYAELEVFKRQHGHCNVSQKYEKNPCLGTWVARQRLIMRQWDKNHGDKRTCNVTDGKSLPLDERVQCLKNLGLEPSIGKGAFGKLCSRNTDEWETQFSNLIKYCNINGNCNVPTKCTSLGRWVSNQRKKYQLFLADEGRDQDQAFGWSKELRTRFKRLKDVGFNFHVGKGCAQQQKST